jgi:hypothetical protein
LCTNNSRLPPGSLPLDHRAHPNNGDVGSLTWTPRPTEGLESESGGILTLTQRAINAAKPHIGAAAGLVKFPRTSSPIRPLAPPSAFFPGRRLALPRTMASGKTKLALVAVLSIQAVLWSHSRQAALDLHSAPHRPSLRHLARQWVAPDDSLYSTALNTTISNVFSSSHDTVCYAPPLHSSASLGLQAHKVQTNICTNRPAM